MTSDAISREIARVVAHAEARARTREDLALVTRTPAPDDLHFGRLVDVLAEGLDYLLQGPVQLQRADRAAERYLRALARLAEDAREYLRDAGDERDSGEYQAEAG